MTFTTRPTLNGSFGMVASSHWLASTAGMRTLELGGNAFDAAVAAAFVLQVVEPHMNGLGGDLSALAYSTQRERAFAVGGQGPAPAAATPERFHSLSLDLVPGTGVLSACVPGAFDGWMLLLGELGTIRLRDALELAIGYAEDGYPVLGQTSAAIAESETLFLEAWPTSAEIYLAGGVPAPGALARNRLLAGTYRRLVAEAEAASRDRDAQIEAARDAFYRGFVAEAIERHLSRPWATDASGVEHRGLFAPSDLAGWRATLEAPVTLEYRDLTFCKTNTWGQGPVLLQQLSLLDGFDLDAMQPGSAEYVHTVVECAKLAFADREAFYGDPDFIDVPLGELLSPGYAAMRRKLVGAEASGDLRPGSPGGREPRLRAHAGGDAAAARAAGAGEPTVQLGDTCHLDVIDRFGNAVAATPSGGWLQSSPAIGELGFSLGTRAQMFWIEPGLANSLAPGKRPRTTLSPTLAMRDGRAALAFGTPGGDQQDQWQLGFLLAHLHFGCDLQAAIDQPSFHTRAFPSSFFPRGSSPRSLDLEGRFAPAVVDDLRRRGHDVTVLPDWDRSRVSAVAREPDGTLRAAASPRGMQCYAVGR